MLRPCAHWALKQALIAPFVDFEGELTAIETLDFRPWASALFTGARHCLCLHLIGEGARAAADAFLAGLSDRDYDLTGHVLIDIALISESEDKYGVHLVSEALTVEMD